MIVGFEDDGEALNLLETYDIRPDRGGILQVPKTYENNLPFYVCDAINYLCDEWDYAWVFV